MSHPARNSDPSTSHQSADAVGKLAAKLRARILVLAHDAGAFGLTISEAAQRISEHKPWSISPRFAELLRSGALVRHCVGVKPSGRPRYATRFDPLTKKNVLVHWLPKFVADLPESAVQLHIQFCKIIAQRRRQPKSTKLQRRAR